MGDTKVTAENGSEQRAKELIAQWMLGGPSLEGLEAKVAGALAACALERDRANREYYKDVLNKAGLPACAWKIHETPLLSVVERAAEGNA